MMRVAVLGGSSVSTPQLAAALSAWAADSGQQIDLTLVGRTAGKLERVAHACGQMAASAGGHVAAGWTTDLDGGLSGADAVVNQVRVGGLEARAYDERFPWEIGLPGEETMGPGGFSNACRTLPVVHDLFARCAAEAPEALVLNLTNPAVMVHQVASRVVGLRRVITLCDSPVALGRKAAAAAGVFGDSAVEPRYAGMNHAGWLTSLRLGDEDLLPFALEQADALAAGVGVDPAVVRWLRALPNPYLRYVYHPERQLQSQRGKGRTRAEELLALEAEALGSYADAGSDPREMAARRPAAWYDLCIVPALAAVLAAESVVMPAGTDNRGAVRGLPDDVMVEVTALLDGDGVHPRPVDALPPDSHAFLVRNAAYERMTVDAVLGGDREARVRALALNPIVPSVDAAREALRLIEDRFGAPGTMAEG